MLALCPAVDTETLAQHPSLRYRMNSRALAHIGRSEIDEAFSFSGTTEATVIRNIAKVAVDSNIKTRQEVFKCLSVGIKA